MGSVRWPAAARARNGGPAAASPWAADSGTLGRLDRPRRPTPPERTGAGPAAGRRLCGAGRRARRVAGALSFTCPAAVAGSTGQPVVSVCRRARGKSLTDVSINCAGQPQGEGQGGGKVWQWVLLVQGGGVQAKCLGSCRAGTRDRRTGRSGAGGQGPKRPAQWGRRGAGRVCDAFGFLLV
ncbi:MAG: hypothetical protein J3K34DRAFT_439599 [Monoraphidium minutum]|nr:MAG: hypothetical protein J3K34DRAFT_439599 [Monoraphidium minutum]